MEVSFGGRDGRFGIWERCGDKMSLEVWMFGGDSGMVLVEGMKCGRGNEGLIFGEINTLFTSFGRRVRRELGWWEVIQSFDSVVYLLSEPPNDWILAFL